MKKIIFTVAMLAMGMSLHAQNNIKDFKTSSDGVKYKTEKSNPEGRMVQEGDLIIGRFAIYADDSVIFDGLKTESQPLFPVVKDNSVFKGDLIDGLRLMRDKETMMFAFPADTMKKYPTGITDKIQAEYIYYKVQIDKLTTMEEFEQSQRQFMEMQTKTNDSLRKEEGKSIEKYMSEHKNEYTYTDGIFVKHLIKGKGAKAKDGDKVRIHYTGQLLDGKVFDSSVESVARESNTYNPNRKYEPIEFVIGAGQMIKGFEAAAKQLSEGGTAIVLLPSEFAYGSRDMGVIKPFSPLLFTMELIEIVK